MARMLGMALFYYEPYDDDDYESPEEIYKDDIRVFDVKQRGSNRFIYSKKNASKNEHRQARYYKMLRYVKQPNSNKELNARNHRRRRMYIRSKISCSSLQHQIDIPYDAPNRSSSGLNSVGSFNITNDGSDFELKGCKQHYSFDLEDVVNKSCLMYL